MVAVTVRWGSVGRWVERDKVPLITCGGVYAAVVMLVAVTVTKAVLVRGAWLVSVVCGTLRRLLLNGAEL